MFPVNISYFNEEIFHFEVIQYVKMVTVFKQWNDAVLYRGVATASHKIFETNSSFRVK